MGTFEGRGARDGMRPIAYVRMANVPAHASYVRGGRNAFEMRPLAKLLRQLYIHLYSP